VTLIALVLLLSGAAINAADGVESDTVERVLITAPNGDVTLHWEATAKDWSGRFRVYRGWRLNDLQIIAEVPAYHGRVAYRHVDRNLMADGSYYQLRYVNNKNREVVLGTVLCREAQATPVANLPALHHDAVDLASPPDRLSLLDLQAVGSELALRELPWCLVPPTPPPEV
jgi:hypothetical protein